MSPRILVPLFLGIFILNVHATTGSGTNETPRTSQEADWFMLQRIMPYDDIPFDVYERSRNAIGRDLNRLSFGNSAVWQSVGPSNVGGRITSLLLSSADQNLIYAGAAAGGVWKSTDNGVTWTNIFNEAPAIGSLAMDPSDPSTIYVGTGEANPGGIAIYPGNGLWRSTNGGGTWTNLGLQETGAIGKIAIHPSNPNTIYVGALGMYRSRTTERGVYRSTNRGATWSKVLYVNDTTGVSDVIIDKNTPSRLFAATWTRYRPVRYSVIGGGQSGLWMSTNGGDSWSPVTNGYPANETNIGRASLDISPSSPNTYFSLLSNGTGVRGIYKSTNFGESWVNMSASFSEGQVWFNNVIRVHPRNPDLVYAGMTQMYRSTNGGATWSTTATGIHVDFHAIEFDPNNPNRLIVGSDGGVFVSMNGGNTWYKSLNLPISQFYAGTLDFTNPHRYYGGLQDNGTVRTLTGSANDWSGIYGGDGFYVLIDPTNPNRIYAESQNGGLAYSTNGGASFLSGRNGINSSDRTNWSTPIAMDLTSPLTLYTGTYRVYRTTNGMASWSPISGDLTRGPGTRIGTLTTIDVAQSNPNVIYVGSDDGKLHVTTNGGTTWNDITGSLPTRWVTRVTVDPDSANVCYTTISGYLEYDFQAHIYRTSDYGASWIPIGGNLSNIPLNDVIVDRVARPRLYVASDAGVLVSTNYGSSWNVLGTGLPESPVHDLELHSPTRKLVAFTHGRSAWSIDVSSLTAVAETPPSVPERYVLHQNYPNPFNPTTTIRFELFTGDAVSLDVFDVTGKHIARLAEGFMAAGEHRVVLDGTSLPSGGYYYRLRVGNLQATRRFTVIK